MQCVRTSQGVVTLDQTDKLLWWNDWLGDEGRAADPVYLDFGKVFGTLPPQDPHRQAANVWAGQVDSEVDLNCLNSWG